MSDPRLQAMIMLQEILEQKIFAAEAKGRLDSAAETDAAFVNMLLQTAFRHLVYIKKILKGLVKKKLPSAARPAYYALILGAAEILYLNTPDYAVINSYVDIVKKRIDKYVGGFVNAVLRKICAEKQRFQKEDAGIFFPNDFRGMLNRFYGKKTTAEIERAAAREPLLDITVKPGFELPDAAVLPLGTNRLQNSGSITRLPGYAEGQWWVQDFSSALPVRLLGSLRGKSALDLCAAPGGKTAQLISAGARTTAVDISAARLERLRENLARLRLKAENIICADAAQYLENFAGEPFDVILLDAPCSATGTLRRHPELVHIKSTADAEKLATVQKRLLELSGRALKPGGTLVYCTCSLSPAEGEKQIAAFTENNPGWKVLPAALPEPLQSLRSPEGWVRILPSSLPGLGGADGFFIALLTKEN